MRLGRQIDHLANRRLGNLSVVGPELGAACDPCPTVNNADPVLVTIFSVKYEGDPGFSNAIVSLTTLAGMGAITVLFFLLK